MNVERTGWRDQAISERHRTYGYNVPAVDIDFLLIEYDRAEPVAIIDYKQVNKRTIKPDSPNMLALGRLRDQNGHQLPFFVVQYEREGWTYVVHPMNQAAIMACELAGMPAGELVFEDRYIRFLFQLRGRA